MSKKSIPLIHLGHKRTIHPQSSWISFEQHQYQTLDATQDDKLLEIQSYFESPLFNNLLGLGTFLFCLILVLLTSLISNSVQQSYTVIFNSSITQDYQGWGTSLAWWAEYMGTFEDPTRHAFLSKIFHQTSNDSLQFNIVRFNMGGAQLNLPNGTTPGTDFATYRGIPSLELPNRTFYWEADQAQLQILKDVKDFGVNLFEAFSNSPPYWMTKNGNSMGDANGGDNLNGTEYNDFANYISNVTEHIIANMSIPVNFIEPFNEPRYTWRPVNEGQEGNHWDSSSQMLFLEILQKVLLDRGLAGSTVITSSDDFSVLDGLHACLFSLDDMTGVPSQTGKVNVHGYPRKGSPSFVSEDFTHSWNSLVREYQERVRKSVSQLWMSETGGYGLGDDGLCSFAFDIIRHLNILKAQAWIYWQVLDKVPDWALMVTSTRYPWWLSKWNYRPEPTSNFFVMQQFSAHIRPGFRILEHSKSSNLDYCHICVVAAFDDVQSKLVLVILNNMAKSVNHTLTVSGVKSLDNVSQIKAFRTSVWKNENHTDVSDIIQMNQGQQQISVFLLGFSILTLEVL